MCFGCSARAEVTLEVSLTLTGTSFKCGCYSDGGMQILAELY